MERMKTPITQETWQKLKSGDGFKDMHGRVWNVENRDSGGDPDRLFARCPGHGIDRLDWNDGQILDEEWGIVIELNHPSVVII